MYSLPQQKIRQRWSQGQILNPTRWNWREIGVKRKVVVYNRLSSVLSVKLRFLPLQSGNKIQDITWLLPVHAIIIWKPFPLGWNFRWTFSEKNFCYRSFVFFLTLPRLEFTTHQSRVSRFYSMFDLPLFVRVCHSYFIKRRDEHVERKRLLGHHGWLSLDQFVLERERGKKHQAWCQSRKFPT